MLHKDFLIKDLSLDDLKPNLLDDFNRFQEVDKVWRVIEHKKVLISEPFVDDWDGELKKEIVSEDFYNCLVNGGHIIAIYNQKQQIIAFSALCNSKLGSVGQYADLIMLHVSLDYRRMGLGKVLFDASVSKAKNWGAKKLYISAHSALESQAFYRSIGCVDAVEPNEQHVLHEPCDCQMEYVI